MSVWVRTGHWLLLAVHVGLGLWAVLGVAEFAAPETLPFGLDNPLFPPWLQSLHWAAIATGSATFLVLRFRAPWLLAPGMALAYGFMAAVCLVETLGYLEHPGRYVDMALEYAAYVAIVYFLSRFPPRRSARLN